MKKRLVSTLIAAVAVVTLLAGVPVAQAGVNGDTISIAFARDEPNGAGCALDPADVTGVVPSKNWNNEILNTGLDSSLVEDVNGVAKSSSAQVFWYCTNTWSASGRGEEENNFNGADHTLMTGYMDQNTAYPSFTIIQISNLPASFSGTYDVYILGMGGYPGKGGEYTVVGASPPIQWLVAAGTGDPNKPGSSPPQQGLYSGPDFVKAIGDDSTFGANGSQNDFGNYLVFSGVSGPTVTIIATNLPMPGEAKGNILPGYNPNPRAPITAVQLVVN